MKKGRSRKGRLLVLMSVLLLGACSSGQPERGVTETTVDGVRIRTYSDPVPPQVDPLTPVADQEYGHGQGKDTFLFTLVSPHAVLEDGTLYILDARETRAHRFTADGTYLGSFGRKGQGPGEFFVLQDLVHMDGLLYTNDPFNRRQTIMELDGTLVRTVPYPDETPTSRFMIPYPFADGVGSILVEKDVQYPYAEGQEPSVSFRILRLDGTCAIRSVLFEKQGTFDFVRIAGRPLAQPFATLTPAIGMAPGTPVAWCYGDSFRIDFLDPEDLSRWAVVIPHEPLPVTEGLRASEVNMYKQLTRSERPEAQMTFPDRLPFVNGTYDMLWDGAGQLWVEEYRDFTVRESPYRYQVFSEDGHWLFQQDLPVHPWLITGSGFYARAQDEEGNPLVRFYRFQR